MSEVAFDIDPAWYKEQQKLEKLSRPSGRSRIKKENERLLVGYVDGVLILAFPRFEVSVVAPGAGQGWFSLNPIYFGELLDTYKKIVRFSVESTSYSIGGFRQAHDGRLKLRLGSDDPALEDLAARIDEIAAEQCYRRLIAAGEKQARFAEALEWHRADHAVNTSPLMERIREHSLIVFRLPEAAAEAPAMRAIVESKQVIGDKIFLLCHDLRGAKITVDPRWVTLVGW